MDRLPTLDYAWILLTKLEGWRYWETGNHGLPTPYGLAYNDPTQNAIRFSPFFQNRTLDPQ
jgi:hypothetical protein